MQVLLIEDDRDLSASMKVMLKRAGFQVHTANMGADGFDLGQVYEYDAIILDLNLPDMDGYEVLKKLRNAKVTTPVLILSGMLEPTDKVRGFNFGADDYLTKPFHRDELIARIHAIVRRSQGHSESVIKVGSLDIDLQGRSASVEGRALPLTGKEFDILELLALKKGNTVSKDSFLDHLYAGMDEPEQKIIDVFVCKLRRKIAQATGGDNYIETVWGRGYALREPTSEMTPTLANAANG